MAEKIRPSSTFSEDRLNELKQVVPETFADGKINWDVLREALGEYVEDEGSERFGLFWPGKRDARRLASLPCRGTLMPVPGEGMREESTRNIFVEGENLEVLKLLQKSYAGRVKVIYIDPPYNTGHDFVYRDDYVQPLPQYLRRVGAVAEGGDLLTSNTKADGRFHSNWLNMIYPRLVVARSLLDEEGVIFVSIDDNEVHNLLAVMNEVFGEENIIGVFIWVKKKKGSHLSKTHRSMTEYVVAFARDKPGIELFGEKAYSDKWQPLAKRTNAVKQLRFPERAVETRLDDGAYPAGRYGEGTSAIELIQLIEVRQGRIVTDLQVNGPFVWTQKKLDEELTQGTRVALSSKFGLNVLRFDQAERYKRPTTLLDETVGVGTNEDAYEDDKKLFGAEGVMDYPKPSSLMRYLVRAVTNFETDAVVLDFFAGSCTTAQATLELNQADGGKRRFVMVQLPEAVQPSSPAARLGLRTIAEIGKERIRRVAANLRAASGGMQEDGPPGLDFGFKVYRLAASNFREWQDYAGENVREYQMQLGEAAMPSLVNGRLENALVEIMLQEGFPLDSTVKEETGFQPSLIHSVSSEERDFGLWVCMDETISEETSHRLRRLPKEDVFVCMDVALTDELKMRLSDSINLHVI